MYEVFPIVAGVLMALLLPRVLASRRHRQWAYAVLGIAVAALATIIAGEEWFFIFIDLAEVFLAIALTSVAVARIQARRTTALQ